MSIDLDTLRQAVAREGRVARVVIANTKGSVPRNIGASMLVWEGGQSGTIGGGALEFEAAARARQQKGGPDRFDMIPLGPELAQCCGGAVGLSTEIWDEARLGNLTGDLYCRPLPNCAAEMPLKVAALLKSIRAGQRAPEPFMIDGWFVEPITPKARPIWIWGAGHVGRALTSVIAPLPEWQITWVDDALTRFPDTIPEGITALPAPDMLRAMALAPEDAHHLILTYSHEIDLALCHGALQRGFASAGLIGSKTKWARFRKRLGQLGHSPAQISRITCPIGTPALGKHPQNIAIGVANDLIRFGAISANSTSTNNALAGPDGGTDMTTIAMRGAL